MIDSVIEAKPLGHWINRRILIIVVSFTITSGLFFHKALKQVFQYVDTARKQSQVYLMIEDTIYLNRDCPATLIPAGYEATLEKGCPVVINQALGGTVTVTSPTGMFRIEKANLDALGDEAKAALELKMQEQTNDDSILQAPFNEEQVWHVLRTCFDPEIPLNIVDLGLIYDLQATKLDSAKQQVDVKMTLTAQGCGMGPHIAADAKDKIESLPEVEFANVQIVWEPVWNPQMISEEGKKTLGLV